MACETIVVKTTWLIPTASTCFLDAVLGITLIALPCTVPAPVFVALDLVTCSFRVYTILALVWWFELFTALFSF